MPHSNTFNYLSLGITFNKRLIWKKTYTHDHIVNNPFVGQTLTVNPEVRRPIWLHSIH